MPDSEPDMTKYQLASTMLAYINNLNGISDGLNFVEDFDDVNVHRDVFKLIFYTMGQNQHYEMMTGSLSLNPFLGTAAHIELRWCRRNAARQRMER